MFLDHVHWTKIIRFKLIWFFFFFLKNYNLTLLEMPFLFWNDLMTKVGLCCWRIKIIGLMIILKNRDFQFQIFVKRLKAYICNGYFLLYLLLNKFYIFLTHKILKDGFECFSLTEKTKWRNSLGIVVFKNEFVIASK
jgi:hypothetical protein